MAGVAAALTNVSILSSRQLGKQGEVEEVIVRMSNGWIVASDMGNGMILVTTTNEATKLGQIQIALIQARNKLKTITQQTKT